LTPISWYLVCVRNCDMNMMNCECLDGKGDNAIKGVQVKVMHLIKGVKYKV